MLGKTTDSERRTEIREQCDAIFTKLMQGGNDAVTLDDYRGLATEAYWLLGKLDEADAAVRSKHAVMEAALRSHALFPVSETHRTTEGE